MKISYRHLVSSITSKPSIDDVSKKLFQLGHEHEIEGNIFDIEFTPNRGDCLSVNGLLRDLAVFYEIQSNNNLYQKNIDEFDFNFTNSVTKSCPSISFLKIDIEDEIIPYKKFLKGYFDDLDIGMNNFFTDISNYLSYETGQPTHCYDSKKLEGSNIKLEKISTPIKFDTLLNKQIFLNGNDLVFTQDGNVINLAGIIGGMSTSCDTNTRSVIIECAYFNPEDVIGKSVKYDLKSEAAHKFERGVDPLCHENILRRFLYIVEQHATIKNVALFQNNFKDYVSTKISFDIERVNNILGTSLKFDEFHRILHGLGFSINNDEIKVPSYRSDIKIENDIAEEIARVIGYNSIEPCTFTISNKSYIDDTYLKEKYIKDFLIDNGFFEVINNPFVNEKLNESIYVDNPLDSSRSNLRTDLKKSLTDNLLYNERRQKDSIKLFEISEIYSQKNNILNKKKMLGIICTGRQGKNYDEFSKKINKSYLQNILKKLDPSINFNPTNISRDNLNTKIKNEILYIEININDLELNFSKKKNDPKINFFKYKPISEFPFSTRDLSFSIKNQDSYVKIQDILLNYNHDLLKEVFIFDFYNNEKTNEIKIGFRFVFQSNKITIKEEQVNKIIEDIINVTLNLESVEIPGLR